MHTHTHTFLALEHICLLRCMSIVAMLHRGVPQFAKNTYQCKIHIILIIWVWDTNTLNFPENSKLVWHPARLIKEGGCVDLSMDTLHLKYPLVLSGSEGSALILPLFLLSPRIIMLCHCSPTMTLLISYGTKWPLCVGVLLNNYSFIHSTH